MAKRYEMHPAEEGKWSIVYTSTGAVVTVEGSPLEELDEQEAHETIGLLEAGELVPDPADGP